MLGRVHGHSTARTVLLAAVSTLIISAVPRVAFAQYTATSGSLDAWAETSPVQDEVRSGTHT